eukprot:CAMPEP_0119326562 /NCGR_PEP_ID=MMETSP1333-20130426/68692_1 /TAXON_ID=418940 /ORGANISM="Scyphosphaera apsteinii, Strain RCC1455" /LENGTH=69 /DNA_ID=CAMNT_0007334897 /DNA_START=9 /DNA_END=214 /DNA_ORIENTATION=+
MQVPYEVKASSIAGVGIYATATIKRGTLLWLYNEESVMTHDEASLRARLADLTKTDAIGLLDHLYTWQG